MTQVPTEQWIDILAVVQEMGTQDCEAYCGEEGEHVCFPARAREALKQLAKSPEY